MQSSGGRCPSVVISCLRRARRKVSTSPNLATMATWHDGTRRLSSHRVAVSAFRFTLCISSQRLGRNDLHDCGLLSHTQPRGDAGAVRRAPPDAPAQPRAATIYVLAGAGVVRPQLAALSPHRTNTHGFRGL